MRETKIFCEATGCLGRADHVLEVGGTKLHLCRKHTAYAIKRIHTTTKEGRFVTIDDKPVFLGGPGQGGGSAGGGAAAGGEDRSPETLEERARPNRLINKETGEEVGVGYAAIEEGHFADTRDEFTPEKYKAFVTPYTPDEYREMGAECYMSETGNSGFAVKPDGDIISVFAKKGADEGDYAVASAIIQRGGHKLDCFDGHLSDEFYPQFGFKETGRLTWDDQYKPEGWNYEDHNRPDVVYMALGE